MENNLLAVESSDKLCVEDIVEKLYEKYPDLDPIQQPKKFNFHLLMYLYTKGYLKK